MIFILMYWHLKTSIFQSKSLLFWYTHTGEFEIDHYEYDQELQQNIFIHAKAYFPVFSRRFRQ